MAIKTSHHTIKGMSQDLSQSKFSSDFAFDARNIRITAREGETLLTVTNEKGNIKNIDLELNKVLGYCVLGEHVTIFGSDSSNDIILVVDLKNKKKRVLYSGHLNFGEKIETLGIYENAHIQKVYWVDGINQPRVINIMKDNLGYNETSFDFTQDLDLNEIVQVTRKEGGNGLFSPGTIQYAFTYYNKYGQESNIFYTTPLLYISHSNRGASPDDKVSSSFYISITNPDSKFDYIRVYSIHRTSIDSVPVVKNVADIEIVERKGERQITGSTTVQWKRVSNNTQILIDGSSIDNYGDKIIYRPSDLSGEGNYYRITKEEFPNLIIELGTEGALTWGENDVFYISTAAVGGPDDSSKRIIHADRDTFIAATSIIDIPEGIEQATFVDTGTTGVDIDPTQLLYIGGESIKASTIAHKDQTLFLGNITLNRMPVPDSLKDLIKGGTIKAKSRSVDLNKDTNSGYYSYNNSLALNTSGFKYGEHYRLGVQFQHKSGKWSEPIFIKDHTVSTKPNFENQELTIPTMSYTLNSSIFNTLDGLGYKKARAVVVLPSLQDRLIVTQGVLCPTVFNIEDRHKNAPYAQSSWFSRLIIPTVGESLNIGNLNNSDIEKGAYPEFRHWYGVLNGPNRGAEIQSISSKKGVSYSLRDLPNPVDGYPDLFMVDQSVLTMHSPDVEFDDALKTLDGTNLELQLVGVSRFSASIGDIDIQTSSPTLESLATGFVNKSLGSFGKGSELNTEAGRSLISGLFYRDYIVDDSKNASNFEKYPKQDTEVSYLIYPWHRSGSLNNDINRPADKGTRTAVLKKKRISNLKFSDKNCWFNTPYSLTSGVYNGITQVQVFDSNEVSLVKIPAPKNSNFTAMNYYGNVDTLITPINDYDIYYNGKHQKDAEGSLTSFTGTDFFTIANLGGKGNDDIGDYQENLKVSRDPIRMKYKSSAHLVFSLNFTESNNPTTLPCISMSGSYINKVSESVKGSKPYWLTAIDDRHDVSSYEELKWYGNTGNSNQWKSLYWATGEKFFDVYTGNLYSSNKTGYVTSLEDFTIVTLNEDSTKRYRYQQGNTVSIYVAKWNGGRWKYILELEEEIILGEESSETYSLQQGQINSTSIEDPSWDAHPFLYIAELYRREVTNPFGGNTEDALKENLWIPAGDPVTLSSDAEVEFKYGDTWYQRYDCLKTYAFTPEDENQIVEILSFMCETRVNIDGRYDRNRGQVSNLNMSPTNFNKLNPIYTQKDNFFNYRILDKDYYRLNDFPTTITWSKEKSLAEEIDTWANITMANTLDLDGDKGKINALKVFNNEIFCFQDSGISNILFNSRVQIPASDGVPIEISNGYKVNGKRYISNTIGCKNKWSIAESPNGLYFLDEDSNGLYLFNGQLDNISAKNGMETWVKNNKDLWYGTFYDKNNGDVYFTTSEESLVYSEKLSRFTSFMSYGNTDFMFNMESGFYAIYDNSIWEQFAGDYNRIYGTLRPYDITIISNQDMPYDKIFNNIEFRADSWNNDTLLTTTFDKLEVWNEYQYGSYNSDDFKGKNNPSWLKKKFRVWRANVPRDSSNGRDRIRNPWAYIKLSKEHPSTERTELHDIMVHYFI